MAMRAASKPIIVEPAWYLSKRSRRAAYGHRRVVGNGQYPAADDGKHMGADGPPTEQAGHELVASKDTEAAA